jgi:uncharacterized protein YkwD
MEMAVTGYFAHNSSTETSESRFTRFGLSSAKAGELISFGFSDSNLILSSMLASTAGHRELLQDSVFTSIGFGTAVTSSGMRITSICLSALPGDL